MCHLYATDQDFRLRGPNACNSVSRQSLPHQCLATLSRHVHRRAHTCTHVHPRVLTCIHVYSRASTYIHVRVRAFAHIRARISISDFF